MFDVFRAYGLAFLVASTEDILVRIRDIGYAYKIDAEGMLPKRLNFLLLEECQDWSNIFGTFKERKDSKKKPPWEDLEEILTQNFVQILNIHRRVNFLPNIGKNIKDGRTLYQTIEVSAAKGFREGKRGSYHEGTQLEVDKYSWAIACIGVALTSVWKKTQSFISSMVPNPFDVLLFSHRTIQNDLDKRVCLISANTALVHYSVRLTLLIAERKLSHNVKYESILFNVMQRTGQQPKPAGGGRYSLTFLEKLATTQEGIRALKEIDKKFPLSSRSKRIEQNLALALTDFLLRPTLENYRVFESLYIRGQINRKFYPWGKEELEELLKYVEIV
jgi:hypothetical protein